MSSFIPLQVKRKSFQKLQPSLPKKGIRDSGKRTNYKQIPLPQERLKQFKRRQVGKQKTDHNTDHTLNSIQEKQYKAPQSNSSSLQKHKNSNSQKYLYKNSHLKTNIQPSKSILSNSKSKNKIHLETGISKTQSSAYSPLKSTHNLTLTQLDDSPFRDDHHNTQSLAQLMKNNSKNIGLMTERKGLQPQNQLLIDAKKQSLGISDEIETQKNKNQDYQGQGSQFDGFLPGEQAQDGQQYAKKTKKKQLLVKKYQIQRVTESQRVDIRQISDHYEPVTQSEKRMQKLYWDSQKKNYIIKQQDAEMLRMLQQYQRNKKQLRMKQNKKAEMSKALRMAKVVGSHDKKSNPQIQDFDPRTGKPTKSLSLPVLKPKRQIIVPIDTVIQQQDLKKQMQSNPYANINNNENIYQQIRIMKSLSLSKFAKANKNKQKTICDAQMITQSELKQMEKITNLFRQKKIPFNPKSVRQGILNLRNVPIYTESQNMIPSKQLPSNPIYKKYPL